jgi:hypothetical protein
VGGEEGGVVRTAEHIAMSEEARRESVVSCILAS